MPAKSPHTVRGLQEENHRLRAQVAQLEDRLDHLTADQNLAGEVRDAARDLADLRLLHELAQSVVSDVVLITNVSGRLTYVSPNVHILFGYSRTDVEHQGHIGFLLPDNLFNRDVLEERGEIANIECHVRDSVGRRRELLVSVRHIELSERGILYTCRDVTERKRIEAQLECLQATFDRKVEERTFELRKSREEFRRLVEGLQDEYIFYSTGIDGIITYVSPSVYSILGYPPDQVVGHNWREFVDQESPAYPEVERIERLRLAGLPTPMYEVEVRHASGETRHFEVRDGPVRDAEGRVYASEGICKDITQRRRAEQELRRHRAKLEQLVSERTADLTEACQRLSASQLRYRSVVEDSPDFIVRWQGDGVCVLVNHAYCRYTGLTEEELIGRSFFEPIREPDRERLAAKLNTVSPQEPVVDIELQANLPDGRIVWQRWSNRALFNEQGGLVEFQSVGCDITHRRLTEETDLARAVAQAQLKVLTSREREVLHLVVAGAANKVIASRLNVSIKTVEKHRASVMRKLGVRSVVDLVRLALLAKDSES
jgi:PAS domain S-box-containing protein